MPVVVSSFKTSTDITCIRCHATKPRQEFLRAHPVFPQYAEVCASCKAEKEAVRRSNIAKRKLLAKTITNPRRKQSAARRRVISERQVMMKMAGVSFGKSRYRICVPRNERITIMANNGLPVLKIETKRKLKTGDIEQMKRMNLTEFAKAFTPEVMRQIGEKVVVMVLTGRNPETNEPIEDKDWKGITSMALQHALPKPTETIVQEDEGGGNRFNPNQQMMQALEGRPDVFAKMLEATQMLNSPPPAKPVQSHIVEQPTQVQKEDAA